MTVPVTPDGSVVGPFYLFDTPYIFRKERSGRRLRDSLPTERNRRSRSFAMREKSTHPIEIISI